MEIGFKFPRAETSRRNGGQSKTVEPEALLALYSRRIQEKIKGMNTLQVVFVSFYF